MVSEHRLSEGTAIITGASAGIGWQSARVLAREGINVALLARREERLRKLANEISSEYGVKALPIVTDVSDEQAVEEAINRTLNCFDSIDLVVNNAGTGPQPDLSIEELPIEQYNTVNQVNIDGTFFVTRASLPPLRESSGILIFVGSFAGCYPRPKFPVYSATKWWLRGFALSLAGQVGETGVAISLVNPSEVRTEFGKEFRDSQDLNKERYSVGEISDPGEVAEAIAFAANQKVPNTIMSLDLFRRDKLSHF